MAKNETRRVSPGILEEDERAHAAIKAIENYSPANPAYTHAALDAAHAALKAAQAAEAQAVAALDAARDDLVRAQWDYHNALLGAGDQVSAQFGKDSNEWQALGKKKKSEFSPRAARSDGALKKDGN
jgi:hypothetical protein